jgi:hypothetical protein
VELGLEERGGFIVKETHGSCDVRWVHDDAHFSTASTEFMLSRDPQTTVSPSSPRPGRT